MSMRASVMWHWLAIGAAGLWVIGCGGGQRGGASGAEDAFACKDRRVAYIVTGSFAGPEVGVALDCAERGPRIYKWVVAEKGGNKDTQEHSLSPGEFDAVWEKIDSTGWRNLGDCENPGAGEGDPVYKIGIQDHNNTASVTCAGKTLPFPFAGIVNELDLKVAEHGED